MLAVNLERSGKTAWWNKVYNVQLVSSYQITVNENVFIVHSSYTNRCTFIKTLIKIYIKVRWLLHVSVYDQHKGACN